MDSNLYSQIISDKHDSLKQVSGSITKTTDYPKRMENTFTKIFRSGDLYVSPYCVTFTINACFL